MRSEPPGPAPAKCNKELPTTPKVVYTAYQRL